MATIKGEQLPTAKGVIISWQEGDHLSFAALRDNLQAAIRTWEGAARVFGVKATQISHPEYHTLHDAHARISDLVKIAGDGWQPSINLAAEKDTSFDG